MENRFTRNRKRGGTQNRAKFYYCSKRNREFVRIAVHFQSPHIVMIPLAEVLKARKRVDIGHETVLTAPAAGISFGG
jgi:hypothetical protein